MSFEHSVILSFEHSVILFEGCQLRRQKSWNDQHVWNSGKHQRPGVNLINLFTALIYDFS